MYIKFYNLSYMQNPGNSHLSAKQPSYNNSKSMICILILLLYESKVKLRISIVLITKIPLV